MNINGPAESKGFAIELLDPDAPGGTFVHWLAYNLPGGLSGLIPTSPTQGRNSAGRLGYTGPCPPSRVHHYHFVVFALNADLKLPAGLNRAELDSKLSGHVIAQGELVATYKRGG